MPPKVLLLTGLFGQIVILNNLHSYIPREIEAVIEIYQPDKNPGLVNFSEEFYQDFKEESF